MATFEMFGGSSGARIPPSAASVNILDGKIRSIYTQCTKPNIQVKIRSLKELFEILGQDKEDTYYNLILPVISLLDFNFNESNTEIRIYSIKVLDIVASGLKKDIIQYSPRIFPVLLLYTFDSDKDVNEEAKNVLNKFIPTAEKKQMLYSKLVKQISARIRIAVDELKELQKNLTESQTIENWNRILFSTTMVSITLLTVNKYDREIFVDIGEKDFIKWLEPTKKSDVSSTLNSLSRSALYQFLHVVIIAGNVDNALSKLCINLLKNEFSPVCLKKIIKVVLSLKELGFIRDKQIREVIKINLSTYYEAKEEFSEVLTSISDTEFINECIKECINLSDTSIALRIFDILYNISNTKEDISLDMEMLFSIFSESLGRSQTKRFYSQIDLKYFVCFANDPRVNQLLEQSDEMRVIDFVELVGVDMLEKWLRTKASLTPKAVSKIVSLHGTTILKRIWLNFLDLPFDQVNDKDLADVFIVYSRTDEMAEALKKYPGIIPYVLTQWNNEFPLLKSDYLISIAKDLIQKQMNLYVPLKKVFSADTTDLNKIMEEVVVDYIKANDQIDPLVFDHFTPTDETLLLFINSMGIEMVEAQDKVTSMIIEKIPSLVLKNGQYTLAQQMHKFVVASNIDPNQIQVDVLHAPTFCIEFWQKVGFERMDETKFVIMLDHFIRFKQPWLQVFVYTRFVDFKFVPAKIWSFIRQREHLYGIAMKENCHYALAVMSGIENTNIDHTNGLQLYTCIKEKPCKEVYANDPLLTATQYEWNININNLQPPNLDDFELTNSVSFDSPLSLALRNTISYITHNIVVIDRSYVSSTVDALEKLLARDSLTHFDFFLILRIFSLFRDTNIKFDSIDAATYIIKHIGIFTNYPSVVENEIIHSISIINYLSPIKFIALIENLTPYFSVPASKYISKYISTQLLFFNAWDVLKDNIGGKLDISNPNSWYLITNSLMQMPRAKRSELLPIFDKNLSNLLDSLDMESDNFIMLVTSFPSTALNWSTKLSNSKSKDLLNIFQKKGTTEVFANISKSLKRLKLGQTKITVNNRNLVISALYTETEISSTPISLEIQIPQYYPFRNVSIECQFGNSSLSRQCEHKVFTSIIASQSIEAGIIVWHDFIIRETKEKEPCPICYDYLDASHKVPSVKCGTCNQKFHSTCLRKWFSRCLLPTCPFCNVTWKNTK